MKRALRLIPLLLFASLTCQPALAQSEATLDELVEVFQSITDGRGDDPPRRTRQCYQQRLPAAQYIAAFLVHPAVEASVFADWQYQGGSISTRAQFSERQAHFSFLFNEMQKYERLGASVTNSRCPDRSGIGQSVTYLAKMANAYEDTFPDADEAPVSVVGYIQWKTARADTSGVGQ